MSNQTMKTWKHNFEILPEHLVLCHKYRQWPLLVSREPHTERIVLLQTSGIDLHCSFPEVAEGLGCILPEKGGNDALVMNVSLHKQKLRLAKKRVLLFCGEHYVSSKYLNLC